MADTYRDPADLDAPSVLFAEPDWNDTMVAGTGSVDDGGSPGGSLMPAYQRDAIAWIRENQTVAMVAGFALGVFVGALMRD